MAKRKVQNENEQIESYLTNDFSLGIYEDLTEGDSVGLFEPLEFFKLLYARYEIVKESKSKPLTVVKKINQLKLTDEQRYCLLDYLNSLICKENGLGDRAKDKQLDICATFIQKEIHRLADALFSDDEAESQSPEENRFDFNKVKQHLETLPDAKTKIKYLVEIKSDYEQQDMLTQIQSESFDDKCAIEIRKLEKLMALDRSIKPQAAAQAESLSRNPNFTTARQVLAIHYLLKYIKVRNVDKTEIARFIEFLTGKNYDSIYKKVREPLKLKDSEAKKDLKFVRSYFEKLGLAEIVETIDKEINS